jgi:acetylornithine deacetylase/succinyl-diaminopimelate desuccinylase-like protein
MSLVQNYIDTHKERFLDELLEILRIPSVSADAAFAPEMTRMAEACAAHLTKIGMENVEICPTPKYPVVYADKIIDKNLPTILCYGHYDVQPADPLELWHSPPFEPVIKKTEIHPDGAIFARGSCDDKGQFFMHLKAVEALIATNSLPCNVKFCIEGEEEIGSPSFRPFVEANKAKLACDVVLCSDTSVIANDTPSITTGVRGLAYFEIHVLGTNRDLHSGTYGGGVPNPINILCEIIAQLKDDAQRITVKGFYDDVLESSLAERAEMAKAPFNLEHYKKDLSIGDVTGEHGYTTTERVSIRPTLDCHGIWGGYQGEGSKTVIASKAAAKFSSRLVPNMKSEKIYALVEAHIAQIALNYPSVQVTVKRLHGGEPSVTPIDTPEYKAAHMAMKASYGKDPIPKREGGYIPIGSLFKDVLGVDSILMGFGLDSDALHSPNEHYGIFNYYKGIETIPHYFKIYTELKK